MIQSINSTLSAVFSPLHSVIQNVVEDPSLVGQGPTSSGAIPLPLSKSLECRKRAESLAALLDLGVYTFPLKQAQKLAVFYN